MADLACNIALLAAVVLAVAVLLSFAVEGRRRKREHRQIVARAAAGHGEDTETAAREATAFWLAIRDSFPFLPTPRPADTTAEAILAAVDETLSSIPSLGEFGDPPMPAPALPSEERRRHLYVLGKTGTGKSTYLEHLIARDLREGRGVGVIAPEGEFFARLLALVPPERREEVIYFAPANPECPLTLNPLSVEAGDDQGRAAEDLFTIFKRSLDEDDLGPRMQPILQNGFAALVGRTGATLWDLKRLLEDETFRYEVATAVPDPYVREFWLETYPRYPKGADLPIQNRLDQFLRPAPVRRTLCHGESSFSIRAALSEGRILFLDLYGLSEETRLLFGKLFLSKFQLELMRRELSGSSPEPFHLYCDEFQAIAGVAEGVWRELLSRGRRYGLSLTLGNQHPAQVPPALQGEIFGNVNSLVAFALGAKDAQAVRKELIATTITKDEVRHEPIGAEELLELPTGHAYAKLAGGRAVLLRLPPPLRLKDAGRARDEAVKVSWQRYGAATPPPAREPERQPEKIKEPESFLE